MITIYVPDKFVPERTYILDICFGYFLGLRYEIKVVTEQCDYIIDINNDKQLLIRDHFFSHFEDGLSYLRQESIPDRTIFSHNPFAPETDIPVIYGNEEMEVSQDKIICGLDIFASSFFMLTRWEEYADASRDNYDRFPASASLALKCGFLHRPVVNEYVEMLWSMLLHLGCNQERKVWKYRLTLTHDIDAPQSREQSL